jgi:hypothetical protein
MAALKEMYVGPLPMSEIRRALGALPGPSLPPNAQIAGRAAYHGLRRPGGFHGHMVIPQPGNPGALAIDETTPDTSIPEPAAPPPPVSRNDAPSVAAIEIADHVKQAIAVPVDAKWVKEWASRNGVAPIGGKLKLADVNTARQRSGLPPFRLVAKPHEAMPPARATV